MKRPSIMNMLTLVLAWGMMALPSCSKDEYDSGDKAVSQPFSNKVTYTKSGSGTVTKFISLLPIPQTNIYQRVSDMTTSEGEVLTDKNYGNQVLYIDRQDFPGNRYTIETKFTVTPHQVRVNLSQIKDIKPYDPNSTPCQRHLGDRGEYIVTSHPYIIEKGDLLWSQSSDLLDYARRCYEYVAKNFSYVRGSWRTLDEILKDHGGECGDFSTLVVNLLRYKGIPSRHNICLRLDGGYHVWVDFYLEGYGWIPLDATYKHNNPKGDFFGIYDGQCIIVMQDMCYDFGDAMPYDVSILQDYNYWYWCDGTCNITANHIFGPTS